MSSSPLVSLLTDFGPGSVYVGQMHAVLLSRAPTLRIVDLAHDCPPGGVAAAAYILQRSYQHFPTGTVHIAVVDPGVGSARGILAVQANEHIFLAPDNGLLGGLLEDARDAEVRRVDQRELMNATISRTFHGRDVFAPVAAYLAEGGVLAGVGPRVEAAGPLPGPRVGESTIEGHVLIEDRFGNLITDIPRSVLQTLGDPSRIRVRVGAAFIQSVMQTFSDVAEGVALTYVGSGDHLEIAVNAGRASDLLGLGVGSTVHVERRN